MKDNKIKIVVLTNDGSLYGKKILNDLMYRDIEVEAVVVIKQPLSYYWKLFKYVQKQVGVVDALYFSFKRQLHKEHMPTSWNDQDFVEHYNEFGIPILYAKGTNSEETLRALKERSPHIIILGQTGIVRKKLLETPKIGTLNAHPGILPYYRGIDCARWAIYHNEFDKIGASVHWVNTGVDTGNIIQTQVYDFSGDETIESLDDKLYNLCATMLTNVVSSIIQGSNTLAETPQSQNEGQQYRKMSRKDETIVQKTLAEFLAQKISNQNI